MSDSPKLKAELEAKLQSILGDTKRDELNIAKHRNKKSTQITRHRLKRRLKYTTKQS